MMRRVLVALTVMVAAVVFTARADGPAKGKNGTSQDLQLEVRLKQQVLKERFQRFEQELLTLAQRLERSSKKEDREKAQVLKDAIKLASTEGIDVRFNKLVEILRKSKVNNLQEVKEAIDQAERLSANLRAMLAILMTDGRDAQIKTKKERIGNILKELEKIIREQKTAQIHTERGNMDPKDLKEIQARINEAARRVAEAIDGNGGKAGESPTPGKKHVKDGITKGEKAAEKLPDKSAADPQSGAIDDYEKARQELEKLLKQLREEEMERLLAQLQQRCEYMLQMQKEVRDATVQIEDAVGKNLDKKPARGDIQKAQGQGDKEGEIVKEARKAKGLIDAEGSSAAFAEIFAQLIRDMEDVQRRLGKADTGVVTVKIENDIIQMLEQMIESLKQAQKDMKNKPSQDGGGGQQQQKLLELVHELKLVKFRQAVINKRTTDYHKHYPTEEQADKPDIQKEVRKLGDDESNLRKIVSDMIKNLSSK